MLRDEDRRYLARSMGEFAQNLSEARKKNKEFSQVLKIDIYSKSDFISPDVIRRMRTFKNLNTEANRLGVEVKNVKIEEKSHTSNKIAPREAVITLGLISASVSDGIPLGSNRPSPDDGDSSVVPSEYEDRHADEPPD